MALLDIVTIPDPILRKISEPVEGMNEEVKKLLDDMLETMYEAPGIGLAAIQVGVPLRAITIDVSRDEDGRQPLFLVNPQIVWRSDEPNIHEEGCLSIPEYFAEVERPKRVKVAFRDHEGKEQELEADGLLATCIQHEIDHLNGVLFIDHISKLKRDMVIRRFTKAAREKERSRSSAL
ncbi:peptide deformylase [Afifella sp. IM 167]|uniref:peptide deformylase n=1 Tax=Afifella sp. IM 167 TaxID=2033586 RepID=UPI001CCC5BB8|nr:peptide deformylase [Afifella sp. IM 167]MBZ8133806.1 peptide deformylase [Afifella sp. IM 167]